MHESPTPDASTPPADREPARLIGSVLPDEPASDGAACRDEGAFPGVAASGEAQAELRALYFKHREALKRASPAPLAEREADRQKLGTIYAQLDATTDKVLDARTLGVLVDSHVQTQHAAMMSHVTPAERLAMLAVIVRRNSFPIVEIPCHATLALSPLLARPTIIEPSEFAGQPTGAGGAGDEGAGFDTVLDEAALDEGGAALGAAESAALPNAGASVGVRPVAPEVLDQRKTALLARIERGLTANEVRTLTVAEAQVLSILASAPSRRLVQQPDGTIRAQSIEYPSPDHTPGPPPEHASDPAAGQASARPAVDVDSAEPHASLPLHVPSAVCFAFDWQGAPLTPATATPVARRRRATRITRDPSPAADAAHVVPQDAHDDPADNAASRSAAPDDPTGDDATETTPRGLGP